MPCSSSTPDFQEHGLPLRQLAPAFLCVLLWIQSASSSAAQTTTQVAPQAGARNLASFTPPIEPQATSPRTSESREAARPPLQPAAAPPASPGLPDIHGFNAALSILGTHDSVVADS